METTTTIPVSKVKLSRISQADLQNPGFGQIPTDHMFISEYCDGEWNKARIVPFADLQLNPFTAALHYGQTVFEGMKAFRMVDDKISVFRLDKHFERFNLSLERMSMPKVNIEMFEQSITELVSLDHQWVPSSADSSLYIRPFMIATEPRISIKISDTFSYMVVASPVGAYYAKPLRLKVETKYTRAAPGGTGFAKCGGNYGSSYYPAQLAKQEGFDQVIWTDSQTHEFMEESGTMNIMILIDNVLISPPLSETILDGVTRSSILALAKDKGMEVEERRIGYRELEGAFVSGKRVEVFGAGTAAVVAPVEYIQIGNKGYKCYLEKDANMFRFKKLLNEIKTGLKEDKFGWNYLVETKND